jgi:hypothetical protein
MVSNYFNRSLNGVGMILRPFPLAFSFTSWLNFELLAGGPYTLTPLFS